MLDLAALEGREAVFVDAADRSFADEPSLTRQEFREQIDFLTQKRGKPTRVWTDAMQGDHDRAFVVAGVTDMAMLDEFQTAVIVLASLKDGTKVEVAKLAFFCAAWPIFWIAAIVLALGPADEGEK